MGQPMKLDVLFVFFSYAGNGGTAMQIPHIRRWWGQTCMTLGKDERIGRIAEKDLSDTPITMTRNQAVVAAKQHGFDVIVMVDSDNEPDLLLGSDPAAKPFWDSSFDFLYERAKQGLPTVVAAPYCGPPPHPVRGGVENVYCFYWGKDESDCPDSRPKIEMYSREHAAVMSGIAPAAALPTGLSMFTLDAFDLVPLYDEREVVDDLLAQKIDKATALRRLHRKGWFYYEWDDKTCSSKGSTEDVTATRDISMAGHVKLKTEVVFCNWDAWAGHMKPKVVGKPGRIAAECVADELAQAGKGFAADERIEYVNFRKNGQAYKSGGAWEERAEQNGQPATISRYQEGSGTHGDKVPPMMTDEHRKILADVVSFHADQKGRRIAVMEVGSWAGDSAVAMAKTNKCDVHCVDHFMDRGDRWNGENIYDFAPGALYQAFLKNTEGLPITHTRGDSVEVANRHTGSPADIVFIDADHSYEATIANITAWSHHLRDDGLMIIHDYGHSSYPGVSEAVTEIYGEGDHLRVLGGNGGFAVVNIAKYKEFVKREMAGNKHVGGRKLVLCDRPVKQLGLETLPIDLDALKTVVGYIKKQYPEPLRIIEVGSWVGASALAMAEALGPNGGTVHCIDHWQGSPGDMTEDILERVGGSEAVYERFCENVGDLLNLQIIAHEGESVHIASTVPPQEAHLVYIDAEHTAEALTADIRAWLPHVRKDGWMAFHDYNTPGNPDVTAVLDEMFGEHVHQCGGSSVAVVDLAKWFASGAALLQEAATA